MAKTLRNRQTQVIVTVEEVEAEKLFKTGDWQYTSKYEIKRQAAIARAKQQQKSEAA